MTQDHRACLPQRSVACFPCPESTSESAATCSTGTLPHGVGTALAPFPLDVEELADLLEEHLYDRGNNVRTWPADEAAAYRELGWSEGTAAARRVMFHKAARAVLAAGAARHASATEAGQVSHDI